MTLASVAAYLLLLTVVGLFFWRVLKVVHYIFREYYVLWNIATGASIKRREEKPEKRLHIYVCKTNLLDEVSINELYYFLIKMIQSDISVKQFHKIILSYKFLISCREKKDGSLRGVMLMSVDRKVHNGLRYTNIRIGLTFFQKYYRGNPLIYYVSAYHMMKELILHPFTPLYMIGKAFSYKSYLVLCHNFSEAYPYPGKETPELEMGILRDFGRSVKLPNEIFNEETLILERESATMKEFVAPVSDTDLETDPHIRFFVKKNPDWVKGHQLVILGKASWPDLIRVIWKNLKKSIWSRGEKVRRATSKNNKASHFVYQRKGSDILIHRSGTEESGDRKGNTTGNGDGNRKCNPAGNDNNDTINGNSPPTVGSNDDDDDEPSTAGSNNDDSPFTTGIDDTDNGSPHRFNRVKSRTYSYNIFNDLDLF